MSNQEIAPIESIRAVDKMDFNEYQEWLRSENAEVAIYEGSDWGLVEDKDTLINVPFVIAGVKVNNGDLGEFSSVRAFKEDGTKIVFNDGGVGIHQQLKDYVAKHGRDTGIICKKGLRVSRYDKEINGEVRRVATYYLA